MVLLFDVFAVTISVVMMISIYLMGVVTFRVVSTWLLTFITFTIIVGVKVADDHAKVRSLKNRSKFSFLKRLRVNSASSYKTGTVVQ